MKRDEVSGPIASGSTAVAAALSGWWRGLRSSRDRNQRVTVRTGKGAVARSILGDSGLYPRLERRYVATVWDGLVASGSILAQIEVSAVDPEDAIRRTRSVIRPDAQNLRIQVERIG